MTGNVGDNIMMTAVRQGVPFQMICNGNAECCTCHMHVPVEQLREQDGDNYVEPSQKEQDALYSGSGVTDESRLAC